MNIVIIYVFLFFQKKTFSDIGYTKKHFFRNIVFGFFWAIILFIIVIVLSPIVQYLIGPNYTNLVSTVLGNVSQGFLNKLIFALNILVGAGITEELQRIFFLNQFEILGGRVGLFVGVILTSAVFGYLHSPQGMNAAIIVGFVGLVLALIYIKRRQAVEVSAAHFFYDFIVFVIFLLVK